MSGMFQDEDKAIFIKLGIAFVAAVVLWLIRGAIVAVFAFLLSAALIVVFVACAGVLGFSLWQKIQSEYFPDSKLPFDLPSWLSSLRKSDDADQESSGPFQASSTASPATLETTLVQRFVGDSRFGSSLVKSPARERSVANRRGRLRCRAGSPRDE